jgi:hypothetical protein
MPALVNLLLLSMCAGLIHMIRSHWLIVRLYDRRNFAIVIKFPKSIDFEIIKRDIILNCLTQSDQLLGMVRWSK